MSLQSVRDFGVNIPPTMGMQNPSDGIVYDVISSIYQGATSTFIRDLGRKVVWAWQASFEALKSEWLMISAIFFGIFAAFGFTWAVQATLVYAMARFVTITWQDRGAQEQVDRLTGENLALRLRVDELNQQLELSEIRTNHAQTNGNLAEEEVQRVRQVRDEFILGRAPLIAERDQLLEENRGLRAQNAQLTEQQQTARRIIARLIRGTLNAVQAKEDQAGDLERALNELQELRNQNEVAPILAEFNQLMHQGQLLYQQSANQLAEQGVQAAGDFGIQTLVPLYRQARETRNQNLASLIQEMDVNSKARIQLERILAISQQEVGHLTSICQLLHLHMEYAIRMRTGANTPVAGNEQTNLIQAEV